MKTQHVIGQRIVGVRQGWVSRGTTGRPVYDVHSITLSNGVCLICHAYLTEDEPIGTLLVNTTGKVSSPRARRAKAHSPVETSDSRRMRLMCRPDQA